MTLIDIPFYEKLEDGDTQFFIIMRKFENNTYKDYRKGLVIYRKLEMDNPIKVNDVIHNLGDDALRTMRKS